MNPETNILQAIHEILKEDLPKDTKITTTNDNNLTPNHYLILIKTIHHDTPTKFTTPLTWNTFNVFIWQDKLIAQQLNPQNGIITRIEPKLADPTCFQTITNYIKTNSTTSSKPSPK